ncbi:MAG: PhzF family phenazine biosynthesis protein [Thermodesulfobacteriota bacterium]
MEVFVVNAFVENGMLGNPAGVCFVDEFPVDEKMRETAAKAGFSETAFVMKRKNDFFIRWWTPVTEVSLCGHATLAAAHMIIRGGHSGAVRFSAGDHKLLAEPRGEIIEMDFPSCPQTECAAPEGIEETLGAEVVYAGRNSLDYLFELKSEGEVAKARPDMEKLKLLDSRGVIVTSACERDGYDFVSRFFAPRVGIDEDPVTGSAHSCLAPYWSGKTGEKKMKGLQISQRGGVVHTEVSGDRVKIGGGAALDMTLAL